MSRNIGFSLFLGSAVSLAALYFAFRDIPFGDLLTYLLSIDYVWIVPSVILILFAFCLRAARWVYILASDYAVSFRQAFHPMMIGFMINCILPGRVGEIVRPVILNRNESIPVSTGLATVVVERIFDLVVLLLLFLLISLNIRISPDVGIDFGGYHIDRDVLSTAFKGMLQLSILLIAGLLLVSISHTRQVLKRVVLGAPGLLPFIENDTKVRITAKVGTPIAGIIDNIASGLALIKKPKRVAACLLYSMAVWFFTALSYYVFSLGCPEVKLSFSAMTAVMVIICFAIALPSVPGYWGLWEAGGMFAMLLFGVTEKEAAGFTLANHVVQIIPVVIVGLGSAWASGISIRRLYREQA